mgnify:CR=1 FL=1
MKTKTNKEEKMTTENKPKLKMTFSHTLEIDFDVLPADMKAEYKQAKKVYAFRYLYSKVSRKFNNTINGYWSTIKHKT